MKKSIYIVCLIVIASLLVTGCGTSPTVKITAPAATTEAPAVSSPAATDSPSAVVSSSASSPSASSSSEPTATVSPQPENSEALNKGIAKNELKYENAHIKADIRYPVISDMADSVRQQQINDNIYSDMKSDADKAEASSKEQKKTQQYQYKAGYTVCRNDEKVLSIRVDVDEWSGGADDAVYSKFYNYVSTGSEPLKLGGLFTSGADYISRVNDAIKKDIAADPSTAGDYFFEGASDDTGFCIMGTNLVIVFNECSIAPATSGEPEFKIPLADLSDILIPELK